MPLTFLNQSDLQAIHQATLDILSEIGHRFGQNMPPLIWDPAGGRFTHHVLVIKGVKQLTDPEEPLEKEEEIKFFLIMVGG